MLPYGDGWEVLGIYEIGNHVIYVARDMPIEKVKHTKRHEDVHSFGIRNEIQTDRIASNDLSYSIMGVAA